MEKLVRDGIPEIIERETNNVAHFRLVAGDEYKKFLIRKLDEEVEEYRESEKVEELADILEVIHALAETEGIGFSELDELRKEKASRRGGFGGGKVMDFPGHG